MFKSSTHTTMFPGLSSFIPSPNPAHCLSWVDFPAFSARDTVFLRPVWFLLSECALLLSPRPFPCSFSDELFLAWVPVGAVSKISQPTRPSTRLTASILLVTTSMVMIIEVVSVHQRALFLGICMSSSFKTNIKGKLKPVVSVNAGYTLGFATGAALGGFFVHNWKVAFLVQIPLIIIPGLLVLVVGRNLDVLPNNNNSSTLAQLKRVDYFGVISLSSALSLLLYTFNLPTFSPAFTTAAIVCFLLFGVIEVKVAQEPIIRLLFRFNAHPPSLTSDSSSSPAMGFLAQPHVICSCLGILGNVITYASILHCVAWCAKIERQLVVHPFLFSSSSDCHLGREPNVYRSMQALLASRIDNGNADCQRSDLAPATIAFAVGGVLVGKVSNNVSDRKTRY